MYEKLLEEFKMLPKMEKKDVHFLDICSWRLSNDENISSNILVFFFDSNAEHELKDLFAKSLIELIESATNQDIPYTNKCFSCDREVSTKSGKRIDLLISNEDIAIFIENKIWAALNNDLDDYFEHIKNYNASYGVVLSLRPISKEEKEQYSERYIFITYEKFFEQVERKLDSYKKNASKKYLTFLSDYIETMKDLMEGNKMDIAFAEFLENEEADELLDRIQAFDRKLKGVIYELKKQIVEKIDWKKGMEIAFDEHSLKYRSIYCRWKSKDLDIYLYVYVGSWGCSFFIEIYKNGVCINEQYKDKLAKIADSVNIKGDIRESDKTFDMFFCKVNEIGVRFEEISDIFCKIVNKTYNEFA